MANINLTLTPASPTGSLVFTIGTPGPAGPGVPPGGDAGQILAKINGVSYNTEWVDPQDNSAVWGQITGYLPDQGDLQGALDAKLDSSTAASTYYPLTNPAGYITVSALAGYATESWVTGQGYLTSSALTPYLTISSASATYYPLSNPSGFITSAALAGYATESWVNSQGFLTSASAATTYFPLSGGALNGNSNVTIADSSSAADSELAGWGLGVQLSADHAQGTTVEYNGLHTYAEGSFVNVNPTGITFPDSTVQVTAYTGGAGSVAWGSVTGYLPDQTDLQAALDAKYDASNPSGFITAGDLAGYATESWVTSQGYATEAFVTSQGYITSAALAGYATESWVNSQGFLYSDANGVVQFPNGVMTDPAYPVGKFWYQSQKFRWTDGTAIRTVASESYVTTALGSYAALSGATFTGKITGATIGVGTPSVNLGGQCDSAPASATNGDVWISNAVAPKLTYRMGGVNYNLPVLNQFNTFTNQMVIDTSSATTAALRVTQRGAGNAIEVEDSTTPDATKFVVDQFGKVGIGVAPDTTAAIKIDGNGMSFNGLVFNPTATAAHTGGSDTLDLLVTINGTNYRLGLRPA
jgi:hypothetical protein